MHVRLRHANAIQKDLKASFDLEAGKKDAPSWQKNSLSLWSSLSAS